MLRNAQEQLTKLESEYEHIKNDPSKLKQFDKEIESHIRETDNLIQIFQNIKERLIKLRVSQQSTQTIPNTKPLNCLTKPINNIIHSSMRKIEQKK